MQTLALLSAMGPRYRTDCLRTDRSIDSIKSARIGSNRSPRLYSLGSSKLGLYSPAKAPRLRIVLFIFDNRASSTTPIGGRRRSHKSAIIHLMDI